MNYLIMTHSEDRVADRFHGPGWVTRVYNYERRFTLGKFKALRQMLLEMAPFEASDFFAFPDPDHEFSEGQPLRIFDAARQWKMELCQPAYCRSSQSSHGHLVTQDWTEPRPVPHIEVGWPVFSYQAMRRNLWTFDLGYSGWGVDFLWGKQETCFALDWLTITHRAVAKWPETAKKLGFPSPHTELAEIRRLYL